MNLSFPMNALNITLLLFTYRKCLYFSHCLTTNYAKFKFAEPYEVSFLMNPKAHVNKKKHFLYQFLLLIFLLRHISLILLFPILYRGLI